jgi:hypothetical protein
VQRRALDVLHRQEHATVGELATVVRRDDVLMREQLRCANLALESALRDEVGVILLDLLEDLESLEALRPLILDEINLAGGTRPQHLYDSIRLPDNRRCHDAPILSPLGGLQPL